MNNPTKKIVITGGSGFLGLNLARALLLDSYDVCVVSRSLPKETGGWKHVCWDGQTLGDWVNELEDADAIVNLAGRTVDCIKSPENCDAILRSRVLTTQLIGKAIREVKTPPGVWIQMSTAHIYGDSLDVMCSEESPFGYGLAPVVGQAWEKTFHESVLPKMRKVIYRTSFVLGRNGGAMTRLSLIAKMGLGGTSGHGKQGISWLHEEDMNRLFVRAIENDSMEGIYVATAPNPVSNEVFMRELRKAVGMPIGLPAFSWMAKIGAPLLFNTDPELVLCGRYCVSKRLAEEGFEFNFPDVERALGALY